MNLKHGLLLVALSASISQAQEKPRSAPNWPAWRGPLTTGEAPDARPPIEWSETKNIKWKVKIPGRGHATPIIWGDRIYVQTAVETDKIAPVVRKDPGGGPDGSVAAGQGPEHLFDFKVLALSRKTGKTLWSTTVKRDRAHEAGHGDSSQASSSPVTDGKNIYAYFGSRGLYCLSLKGKIIWKVDLGTMTTYSGFGEGSSPALHGDTLVIVWDHEGDDFIVAFDKKTGKEKWRVARNEEHTNWATPLIIEADGKPQVVVSGHNYVRAYDLESGKEIWRCNGLAAGIIPSPVALDDLVFAMGGSGRAGCLAIRYAEAVGDISDSATIAWRYYKDTPHVPSAVLCNDKLYFLDGNRPQITCLDAKTGTPVFTKQRLVGPDTIYASLLAAAGHVYAVGRNGTTVVLKDDKALEIASTNKLDDEFAASPAAVGNQLFLRGITSLYCIAKK